MLRSPASTHGLFCVNLAANGPNIVASVILNHSPVHFELPAMMIVQKKFPSRWFIKGTLTRISVAMKCMPSHPNSCIKYFQLIVVFCMQIMRRPVTNVTEFQFWHVFGNWALMETRPPGVSNNIVNPRSPTKISFPSGGMWTKLYQEQWKKSRFALL